MQHIDVDQQKKARPAYNGLSWSDYGFIMFLHGFLFHWFNPLILAGFASLTLLVLLETPAIFSCPQQHNQQSPIW